jgi:hypothetical protein
MAGLPKASQETGHDTSGRAVKLGDIDSDGYPVGYIDPEGLAHESRKMAEFSRASGRFIDALTEHLNRHAPCPAASQFVRQECSPEFRDEGVEFVLEQARMWMKLRSAIKADPDAFKPRFAMPASVDRQAAWC